VFKQKNLTKDMDERIKKVQEQIIMITNERKKDIEETSDYIKTMVGCTKKEIGHDLIGLTEDMEKFKLHLDQVEVKKVSFDEFV
jgi:hypothetical protein